MMNYNLGYHIGELIQSYLKINNGDYRSKEQLEILRGSIKHHTKQIDEFCMEFSRHFLTDPNYYED